MDTTKRKERGHKSRDEELMVLIKDIVTERPTYGYRRVTALLNGKLKKQRIPVVNHKRVYRLMKLNGLLLQKRPLRPKRAHTGKVEAIRSNIRWCSDSFSIQCLNGEQVHVAFSIDACDREAMRYISSTKGIDGQAIRDLMLESIEYRFGVSELPHSIQWLSDNGSCYTARETVAFGYRLGLDIRTTPVYSPESNGLAEAFVKTFKRDYVWFGDLENAETVMSQLPHWFEDYNEKAPHKALKMRSPREHLKEQKLAG
ncbi:MAG: IS3 family transposase ISCpr2 [Chlamydiales bacterium]|nr:IS3 family transposase ISCpr2 [Chlamydiales bacterium]